METLQHDQCYKAVQARDARFDGRFFTAVKSTGIFCRPICPAPTPKAENCTFYPTAAAAQAAGYRPCLRCHPELAPAINNAMGANGIASRALRLITNGALDEGSVDELAKQLNVSTRHLRRVCVEQLGASPVSIAQTKRLLFAKQLIDETDLSFTDIAFAAGFSSIRRFNAVFQSVYQRSPTELRRSREEITERPTLAPITLKLPYSPPYNWPQVRDFLAHRAIPGVEVVTDNVYRRTIALDGDVGTVAVCNPEHGEHANPRAKAPGYWGYLTATIRFPKVSALGQIVTRLRAMFDLDADAQMIAAHLGRDPLLKPLVEQVPGVRIPGCWDGFEVAMRAVLGQQISVVAAQKLLATFVEAYGTHLNSTSTTGNSSQKQIPSPLAGELAALAGMGEGDNQADAPHPTGADASHPLHAVERVREELTRVFPSPAVIAGNEIDALRMPGSRKKTLRSVAQACLDDPHLLEVSENLVASLDKLDAIWGIGPWTAAYIAMRGLHEPDAFPVQDAGVKRGLTALGIEDGLTHAERWRPWRAYATMVLWNTIG